LPITLRRGGRKQKNAPAKGGEMARIIYKNKAGERLPGVTTIIAGLGWNKEGLMWWANQMGLEGKSHRDVAEKAADAGTLAHAMIELELKGRPAPQTGDIDPAIVSRAETAYLGWCQWAELVKFQLIASELSLVSEKHGFGGTLDIAAIQGVHSIIDLKTSGNIYPDHWIQVAAYGRLYNENYEAKIEAYYILRIDKLTGGFDHSYRPELNDAWEAFQCLLRLHQLKNKIK